VFKNTISMLWQVLSAQADVTCHHLSNKGLSVGSHTRLWRVQDPTQHNQGFSTCPKAGI